MKPVQSGRWPLPFIGPSQRERGYASWGRCALACSLVLTIVAWSGDENATRCDIYLRRCADLLPTQTRQTGDTPGGFLVGGVPVHHSSPDRHGSTRGASMPTAVAQVLASGLVDTTDIARVLTASQRSVQRWTSHDVAPRKEAEERLLELAAVLDLAAETLPADAARLWIR